MRGDTDDAGALTRGAAGSEAESGGDWGDTLKAYLIAGLDKPPVSFGDLLDRFAPMIPRHEIERAWHGRHPDQEMVAPNRKLADLLRRSLNRFRLEIVGTERAHGREWTRDTRVRAISRPCVVCGDPVITIGKAVTCGISCGNRSRVPRSADDSIQASGEFKMTATATRHPEIIAIETIFEALRGLPDRGARERAMAYAKQLIEAEETTIEHQPPPLAQRANGASSDAAP